MWISLPMDVSHCPSRIAEVRNGVEREHRRSGTTRAEQPSDPTPDTAAESADPSGTGERVDR